MSWLNRISNLLHRGELGQALDEELEFHLKARIRDNVQSGMTLEEAERDAARRFGNRTLTKERTRDMDIVAGIETIGQDLRYALRNLRKNPGFTSVALLALALGIGANTAVFAVVNGVLLRPLPFPDPSRLQLISYRSHRGPDRAEPALSDRDYIEFQRVQHSFEAITTFGTNDVSLTGAGDPIRVPAGSVTPSFFPVFGVNPGAGRPFLAEEDQTGRDSVVVVSDKLWRTSFAADPALLGKNITLDGVPRKVIGVMPAGFSFPGNAQLWIPLAVKFDPHNTFLRAAVGRLKQGVSLQQAQAELEAFATGVALEPGENRNRMSARILPLKELLVGSIRQSLVVFAGAVAFVLLIACANVANLLLMRAASRRHEIAMRAALGASRRRLIRQLLTESTLVSLGGAALGIFLAISAIPALIALAPEGRIPRVEEIRMDGWVLAFTVGVAVVTGIVFGLAPAFRATRLEVRESLSHGGRSITASRDRLRGTLVIVEIALALVLLTGAGLMLKSFLLMQAVNPGFHPENVLTMTVDLPDSVYQTGKDMEAFHQRTLAKLSHLPGVVAAGAVNWLPFGGAWMQGDFQVEGGKPMPPNFLADKPVVSPEYFRALGIRLMAGRYFTEGDNATEPRVAIISQTVARTLWPGEDPVGKRISLEDHPKAEDWQTITGVVEDVRQRDLKSPPASTIYQPIAQVLRPFLLRHMVFLVRTNLKPESLAPAFRAVLHDVDKDQPVQTIASMNEIVSRTTAEPKFQARLLIAFSTLALVLAAIGIYGVLAYSVAERTQEIGIRMALGADRSDVVHLVLRRTLLLTGAGLAIGVAGALAITRVLGQFLFDVKPTDPGTFVAVALLLSMVALLAGLMPARRAATVDPLVALRHQ